MAGPFFLRNQVKSVVAIDFFATLMSFLRFKAKRRDRPRVQPFQADRIACVIAVAVFIRLDPGAGPRRS